MAYQALYRKWRPRTFDDVVGQQHITETLKRQVAGGRLSHAYLFVGTRGTGKTTCAKILSRAVNCEHPVDGNPCNECAACRGIEDGSILEVEEIDAASNNGVDNVRILRDEAMYSPASVRKRVYIIDEVHMLSAAAFNALLKILEEPPEHLLFILATTELNKVPATILSRCQRFNFRRITTDDIVGRLTYVASQEGIDLTPEGAAMLARLADGGMRDALSLLDQCSGDVVDENRILNAIGMTGAPEILTLFRSIRAEDPVGILQQTDLLYRGGKDMTVMLGELQQLLRDILVYQLAGGRDSGLLSGMYSPAELAEAAEGLAPATAMKWMETLRDAGGDRADQKSVRLRAETALLKLSSARLRTDAEALADRVAALEQRLESGDATAPSPAEKKEREPERIAQKDVPVREEEEPASEPEEEILTEGAGEEPAAAPVEQMPEKPAQAPEEAPEESGSAGWKQVLDALKGKVDDPTYIMLADPDAYEGERQGVRLIVRCGNPFARIMADTQEIQTALKKAAEAVFGRPTPVILADRGETVPEPPAEKKADKLDELAAFDIVRFK
ncbi:MAG: DNA polymerase III subunit gamma/tau [Oscillospiraceae bacterium]|nr:DNA polymerase III subunit gamma/tau [Oscillospiraceae bacterium]